jgi:predicted DCC family thiol-disulfide oxidoreductase YuxK
VTNNPVILFDGVCNLCNGAVQYIIKHDAAALFKFASLQSETGQQLLKTHGLQQTDFNSFVLIQNNKAFTKSAAALMVSKKLNGPVKLLGGFIFVPSFIRDGIYNFIARNRYKWFGKKESCMLPTPALESRFLK